MDYLDEARKAVEASHACKAMYENTVAVTETFQGKVAWDGEVEVFSLSGHPKAKWCYVWGYPNVTRSGKYDFVTVLQIPPVTSAKTAVQAAIAAKAR